MVTAAAEVERKFTVPRSRRLPALTGAPSIRQVGSPQRFTQVAVYYDTPDLQLLAAKITLRRRTGGSDDGWHLKTPGTGDRRTEHHVDLHPRDEHLVPAELRELVAEVIRYAPLVPVATLSTRRSVRDLKGARGKVLAQAMDDTVTASLWGAEPHDTWREVEVELVRGESRVLEEVAQVLLGAGIEPSASPSKVAQALAPRIGQRPALTTTSPAGEVLMAYVAAQVGVLQGRAGDLRVDAPDAVHKSRVATRRLRSLLKTFRPVLDRTVTDPLRSELAWFAGVLGAPRDAEVQRDGLTTLLDSLDPRLVRGPVKARLAEELGARHAAAHAALVNTMERRRYQDLMRRLALLVATPPLTDLAGRKAKKVLPALVGKQEKVVDQLAKKAAREEDPDAREELLHDVRKSAKAARYACEAVPVFGDDAARGASAWEAVTEVLGNQQDSVVAREELLSLATIAAEHGEETFTYGVLHGQEAVRSLLAVTEYEAALAVARSPQVRGWTTAKS